jgi:hypothetical protein
MSDDHKHSGERAVFVNGGVAGGNGSSEPAHQGKQPSGWDLLKISYELDSQGKVKAVTRLSDALIESVQPVVDNAMRSAGSKERYMSPIRSVRVNPCAKKSERSFDVAAFRAPVGCPGEGFGGSVGGRVDADEFDAMAKSVDHCGDTGGALEDLVPFRKWLVGCDHG